jgi:hypothetical protein
MLSLKKEGATFTPRPQIGRSLRQDARCDQGFPGPGRKLGQRGTTDRAEQAGSPRPLAAAGDIRAHCSTVAVCPMEHGPARSGAGHVLGSSAPASVPREATPNAPRPAETCGREWAASKRVLATPSAEDRFDFSGRNELYSAYIPWAVAFDCAKEWAAKYEGRDRSATSTAVLHRRRQHRRQHCAGLRHQLGLPRLDDLELRLGGVCGDIELFGGQFLVWHWFEQWWRRRRRWGGAAGFRGGGGGGGGGGGLLVTIRVTSL